MASDVTLERHGWTAVVTIDNPPVNTLHPRVAEAISACAREIADDPAIRCMVLTGTGRHFVAGGDLRFVQTLDQHRAERYVLGIQAMQDQLRTLPQPVIAAINGTALGGGCELAMACDIRIAAEDAVLGQPEVTLGIIPGAGGTQHLPRLIPPGRAKLMVFTGESIGAREAETLGLVDRVVPAGEALSAALETAERIGRNAPLAVSAAKRAMTLGTQMSVVDGHRLEAALFAPLVETDDFAEGAAAFFEKRPPTYHRR